MNAFDAKEIASHFGFEDINEVHEISSGHINATYRLDTGKGRFILQRVNTSVFADPGRMMENISIVLGKIPRLFLVPALDGRPYYENGSGFTMFLRPCPSPEIASVTGSVISGGLRRA